MTLRVLALAFVLAPGVAFGQAEALLPMDDVRMMLIGRLQRRGLLDALDPTSLPHRQGDVRAALARVDTTRLDATARAWLRRLTRTTASDQDYSSREVRAEAELSFGLTASDTRRLDGLRPLALDRTGDPDANTEVLNAGRFTFFPNAMPRLVAERPGAVVHFAPRHDLYLNSDPDGLDLVRRAMLRSDESYVRLRRGLGAAALGRYRQHWGRPGEDAVLLSDWARSFDRLTVRLGGTRYSLETVFGELDAATADGRFTGNAGDVFVNPAGAHPRYVAAHRLRLRPASWIQVSAMEMLVYGGPTASPTLRHLVPLAPFVIEAENPPKNNEENGLIAGEVYVRRGRLSATVQAMADDLDFVSGAEPASLAGSLALEAGGVLPGLDLRAGATAATARAYRASPAVVLPVFGKRSLGLPYTDHARAFVAADWYPSRALGRAIPGLLAVSPRLDYLVQGEGRIVSAYPDNSVPAFLVGTVVRTLRASARVRWDPAPWAFVEADYGVARIENAPDERSATAAPVPGRTRVRPAGWLRFGLNLRYGGIFRVTD